MIYLRFVSARWSLISAAIRFGTRSWASHVELIKVYDAAPWAVYDVLACRWPRGIQHYPYITKGVTQEQWWTAPNLAGVWSWMEAHVGQRYDLASIFGFVADEDWHKDDRDICSESLLRGSESTPTPWLNPTQPVWRVSPRDLLLSPYLQFVRRVV